MLRALLLLLAAVEAADGAATGDTPRPLFLALPGPTPPAAAAAEDEGEAPRSAAARPGAVSGLPPVDAEDEPPPPAASVDGTTPATKPPAAAPYAAPPPADVAASICHARCWRLAA